MAVYTTTIRNLVENNYDLGLKLYPLFNESYRETLNAKIIEHYYLREIGAETAGRFKLFLNRRMNEIMPYYNQLYASQEIHIEPLLRLALTEEFTKEKEMDAIKGTTEGISQSEQSTLGTEIKQNSSTTISNNSTSDSASSDTPNSKLKWEDIEGDLYLTNANMGNQKFSGTSGDETESNSETVSDRNSLIGTEYDESKSIDEFEEYLKVLSGNPAGRTDSEMLMEFRDTFLNIDLMIIEELEDLFMQIW